MLAWRLVISALLIPALVAIFVLDHRAGPSAPYLLILALLLAARGAWEMIFLLRTRIAVPDPVLTIGSAMAVVAAGWIGPRGHVEDAFAATASLGPVALVFALSILLLFLVRAAFYVGPGNTSEALGAEVLTVAYVGVLLAVTAQLRWVAGAAAGYLVLGSLVIATKCGDIGAYTLGRLFGKRKMIPRLSPGKTWMGALGALLGSGLAAWAWLQFATPRFVPGGRPPEWYWSVLYGIVLGGVGLIGDLCESLIKRDMGQKDSAPLLPGFGGLLDLIDSVIYAGPVAYLLWLALPLATWS
jgi:phosphatidate cytidylyltransferase